MSDDFEVFVRLVESVDSLSSEELRKEIVSRPVDFVDPGHYWEWKQSHYESLAHFIVLATRSLDGSEDDLLATTLVENLHLTVPWCVENVAELSMLLIEEFIEKKMALVRSLLQYMDDVFRDHPDFSEKKDAIFDDFIRYRAAINDLKFHSLTPNWIDGELK